MTAVLNPEQAAAIETLADALSAVGRAGVVFTLTTPVLPSRKQRFIIDFVDEDLGEDLVRRLINRLFR